MATLYEISGELAAILGRMDEPDAGEGAGELTDSLFSDLDKLGLAFNSKVDGVLRARVNYLASAEGLDVEIRRLTALRDSAARRAEWLKQYIFQAMLATGQVKLQTALFKLWIQKNGRPSISLADGADIPEGLKRTRVEFDGEAAYLAWKAGETLPACVKVIHGSHLRIK